ncbi:MAG: T9SS type A sorting domain-containing protein [Ferruginibacter sp.]
MRKSLLLSALFFCVTNISAQSPHDKQLYGLLDYGGVEHKGVIFHYTPATRTLTTDYEFQVKVKGKYPKCDIVNGGNGKYYGTTTAGGNYDAGVIFQWDSLSGDYSEPYHFTGADGKDARGGMVLYNGKLYGLTNKGGTGDFGVIYEWDIASGNFSKKIDMDSVNGKNPDGSLTLLNNKFYGFTAAGGANDKGVLFEWDPSTNIYTKKFDFDSVKGSHPVGKLSLFSTKLYALTNAGGVNNKGIIYEWDYVNNIVAKKIDFNGTNGAYPLGYLSLYNNKFYGVTYEGGIYQTDNPLVHSGVVFEWNPVNNVFAKKKDLGGPNKTGGPMGSFTYFNDLFWGIMTEGTGGGDIFSWSPVSNVLTESFLNDFTPQYDDGRCDYYAFVPGVNSSASFLVSGNKLLASAPERAGRKAGSIYEYYPDSNQITRSVHMLASDGAFPKGGLTRVGNKLYALTYLGGNNHAGNIIEWDLETQQFKEAFQFDGYNTGIQPKGTLTFYNGKLYGINTLSRSSKQDYWASWGNGRLGGDFFSWDPVTKEYRSIISGVYTAAPFTLHNGKFYTTLYGGFTDTATNTFGYGAIIQFNPVTGAITTKAVLPQGTGGFFNLQNNESANGLTYYNGKFYGLTASEGIPGNSKFFGTIYEWDTTLTLTTHRMTFDYAKGTYPLSDMALADSVFYGFTSRSGDSVYIGDHGSFFKWNPETNVFEKKSGIGGKDTPLYSDGKIYFVGGSSAQVYLEEYDPVKDTIIDMAFPTYPDWTVNGPYQWLYDECVRNTQRRLLEIIPNKNPLLSDVPLVQTICTSQTGTASFKITDADDDTMHFIISSSNAALLPVQNIAVTHTDSIYTITYAGANNQTGNSTITVSADDGYGGKVNFSFPVTINSTAGPQPCVPVPVTLLYFSAEAKESIALLSWKTTAEINVKEYVLERSTDGFSFTKTGTIKALNNLSGSLYSFTDINPFPGNNYYRLKSIDTDGIFNYSYVRTVVFEAGSGIVKVYPNPAKSIIVMEGLYKNKNITIRIADLAGRTVCIANKPANKRIETPVHSLQRGIYLLSIYDGDKVINRKVIKE